MDEVDRIELLLKLKHVKKKDLEKLTEVASGRWSSIFRRKVKTRLEDIAAIAKLFPSYEYWLYTGKELPESGQVNPLTEEIQSTG